MKGVIFSTSFFILSITLFFALGWYVNFDNQRSLINNNFKKSMIQTGYILAEIEDVNKDLVLDTLISEVEGSLPHNFYYHFDLLGFNSDPFLIRVKLQCNSKNGLYNIILEETLIEKEIEDAKK